MILTQYIPDETKSFPYPFGFDPYWKGADNELDFFNSFKMKFSVIVAFVHMTAGVILKAFNCVYFKDHLTLWFEFVPQLIFLVCLVGYMDFLIVLKWVTEYHGQPRASIISTIIGMSMMKTVEPEDEFFSGQHGVQTVLLFLMLISVPWMLLPKPIIELIMHNKSHPKSKTLTNAPENHEEGGEEVVPLGDKISTTGGEEEEDDFEFGEAFIHQMIETIEFVLGAISNTASYLRLWALSLAHQQLALVSFHCFTFLHFLQTIFILH